jgi:hypothetical protein
MNDRHGNDHHGCRPGRRATTLRVLGHCEICGSENVAVNEDAYCRPCASSHVEYLSTRSEEARRMLTLMLDAALDGRIHPEDLRELVAERIAVSAEQYWASPVHELRERGRELPSTLSLAGSHELPRRMGEDQNDEGGES